MSKQKSRVWNRKRAQIAGYTDEFEFAEQLGLALRTLRKWRFLGQGPAYVKIARRIYYRDEAVAAWVASHEVRPTREFQLEAVTT
jgi:hypothetical protein